jgi:glycosyltransferase involved in cell wall biosynthesis
VRVCLVYDCLYPYTVGGGERWLRAVGSELARAGHDVTYLTRKQWPDGEDPDFDGVRVIAVSPGGELYTEDGRRKIGPPLRFGLGVFRHLLRNRYDTIHCAAFPYFALLAARIASPRTELRSDWFEVWSREYWLDYLGPIGGRIGFAVQRLCVRATSRAFVVSQLHAQRLREEGLRSEPIILAGIYAGPTEPDRAPEDEREPLVLYAGRHIPEKRVDLLPGAIAQARRSVGGLRGLILGDGPESAKVRQAIEAAGASAFVEAPGFVSVEEVHEAFTHASCFVLPSEREGYGTVVIEAAAAGVPSVVVAAPDNAAVERIEEGVNGFVAASVDDLPDAIVRVHEAGAALRRSTADWFAANAKRLSAAESAKEIAAEYTRARPLVQPGPQ